MKKVALLSTSNDLPSVEKVAEAVHDLGGQAIRIDTDQYPGQIGFTLREINGKWDYLFHAEGESHELANFESLWYRRLAIGRALEGVLDKKYLKAAISESRKTFFGMLETLPIFQLDSFKRHHRAERKQLQLQLAQEVGLAVPKTLITNDSKALKAFFKDVPGGLITKMQASFAIMENGQENVVFTNYIGEEDFANLEGLEYCPMMFQQRIQKELELRITVVGDNVFASAIDSKQLENAKEDWRKEGDALLDQWRKYELPAEIKQRILAFMDAIQLNYGAIDMILTPENELFFLEVNPGGEFWWQEIKGPKFPICQSLAGLLMGKAGRR